MRKTITILFFLGTVNSIFAQENPDHFDFLLALTQQNTELDWWHAVPDQFGPKVSVISSVKKKEYFKILPIFNGYGTTKNGNINITFDMEIQKPDGTPYEQMKNCNGYKGKSTGSHLLPAVDIVHVCFEEDDPYGEYTIKIKATDHINNQSTEKYKHIRLEPFQLSDIQKEEIEAFYLNYSFRPQPAKALAAFLQPPRPYLNDNGEPVWGALWFYKIIFEENDFLIPHTVTFFEQKATALQKKNIFLLFHFLNKTDILATDKNIPSQYKKRIKTIKAPDPYAKITTGSQLDMLWAEFFATSRIKPVHQIMTALNLSKYTGTLDKVKAKELDIEDKNVMRKAMLEATFQSALWSIRSNCEQSQLCFRYCVGLHDSERLSKNQKKILGMVLDEITKNKDKESYKHEQQAQK